VVGIGAGPDDRLTASAGLPTDNGVLVDARLRAQDPHVYAAGDVANHDHPFYGRRVRVEHWANALNQGPAAARNMLGAGQPYERLPYFYSDQYDVGMEYSGLASAADEVVIRGSVETRKLIAFWLQDGRVAAGMNMNVWDVTGPIQELIRSRAQVDRDRLRDEGVPLEELAAG
jgi:3-phenylpropionate/trans-cinnamate dioxygenase ferredoxin reductase component